MTFFTASRFPLCIFLCPQIFFLFYPQHQPESPREEMWWTHSHLRCLEKKQALSEKKAFWWWSRGIGDCMGWGGILLVQKVGRDAPQILQFPHNGCLLSFPWHPSPPPTQEILRIMARGDSYCHLSLLTMYTVSKYPHWVRDRSNDCRPMVTRWPSISSPVRHSPHSSWFPGFLGLWSRGPRYLGEEAILIPPIPAILRMCLLPLYLLN